LQQSLAEASRQAQALKAQGRLEDALALHRRIVAAFPTSAVARHNLASALGDAGYWAEVEPIVREAQRMGLDAPETWLVLARALQATGQLDEAEDAYMQSLRRRSGADAHRELVQLRWMRGAKISAVCADLDGAIAAGAPDLAIIKAQALMEADEAEPALALLEQLSLLRPDDGAVATITAQAALAARRNEAALAHARRAIARAPDLPAAHAVLVEALLSAELFEEASNAAAAFRRAAPLNQHAIALQATAWRALGDSRYRELFDYDAFVSVTTLDTPPGWSDLSAYVSDLAVMLKQAHHFQTHPFAQSIRRGSQAANILQLQHPAARALPTALRKPIQNYIDALGAGADPMRARRTGAYKFEGMWSILMRAGGAHINHVHPHGWISSACYVEVPTARTGSAGCLQLGEPSVTCGLEAERSVEPIPGRLVLFPSYMWHGTVPFSGDGTRLTFAFDVLPA
jgi:tetratricopeptide (TPR) repeat protein